ncbi:MAG: hypothetical protein WC357_04875, partial [Candidatus Omnitrophota bacterium]
NSQTISSLVLPLEGIPKSLIIDSRSWFSEKAGFRIKAVFTFLSTWFKKKRQMVVLPVPISPVRTIIPFLWETP